MLSMGSKRKASQQKGPPPKQLRESQYDIETTLPPDEEDPEQPQNQKMTGPASAKAQLRVKKIPLKQKKAIRTRQSARKTGSNQEKASSKDNDTSNTSLEVEVHQEPQPKQASPSGAKARASNKMSRASKEVPSLAQPPLLDTATVTKRGFAEATTDTLNNPRGSSMARPIRVESRPRAQVANINRTPIPPSLGADNTDDRELQASINKSSQQPKSSLQMGVEYQAQRISKAISATFYGYGLQWNDILRLREALLVEKITIEAKKGDLPYYVSQCPLSKSGKQAMKFLGPHPKKDQMETGLVNDKLSQYAEMPASEPELFRADLCHLIIPRLIRHIHLVYGEPGIEDDNETSLQSAAKLLKTLSDLCHNATHIENVDDVRLLGLETLVDDTLERIKVLADDIGGILEQRTVELESSRQALEQQKRVEREERYKALLQAKHMANKTRSDTYWNQELPDSETILSEIPSTGEIDNRLWRRKASGRIANYRSFTWTPALTDILTNELIKHQDRDVEYRYEQCLKCEPLSSLTVGEIRRRALEIKPFLEEEWLKMTNSVPRYVWTIE